MKTLSAFFLFALALLLPATVLATNITIDPISDTYVDNQNATTSYGGRAGLYSYYQPASKHSRLYLRFPVTQIPPSAIVSSAKLKMYLLTSTGVSPVNLELYRASGTWGENMTWNDQDDLLGDSHRYAIKSIDNTLGWKEWDITGLTQEWVNGQRLNFGLMIIFQSGLRDGYSRDFFSKEMLGDIGPKLEVTYSMPTPTPTPVQLYTLRPNPTIYAPSNFFGNSGLQISNIAYSSVTSNSAKITWKTNIIATSWVYYGQVDSNNNDHFDLLSGQQDGVTNHTVNLTGLSPNKKYSFKVFSRDSNANPAYGTIGHFQTLLGFVINPNVFRTPSPSDNQSSDNSPSQSSQESNSPTEGEVTNQSANPVESASKSIEDKLVNFLVGNSGNSDDPTKGKPGENQATQSGNLLNSKDPLVLVAGTIGINRLVGIFLIIGGIGALAVAYLLYHTGKKIHRHINSRYNN